MVALTGLFSARGASHRPAAAPKRRDLALPVLGGLVRMSHRPIRALLLCSLACLFAHPAAAQITGNPIEASVQGGWSAPDARAHMKSAPAYGGSLGWRAQSWFVLEAQALYSSSKADTLPEQKA